jgi:hypothetical protein
MAVFGAPFVTADDPDHAVEAAVEMVRRLRAFNQRWGQQGHPPLADDQPGGFERLLDRGAS